MNKKEYVLALWLSIISTGLSAQISTTLKTVSEEQLIRRAIIDLTADSMSGRGYVNDGKEKAAHYIENKFKEYRLRGIYKAGGYEQNFYFPVNTFPGKMLLSINGDDLVPGQDFIIDPSSSSFYGDDMKIVPIDLKQVVDTQSWVELINTFSNNSVYYFDDIETVCKNLNIKEDEFPFILPKGCYIIKGKEKLTWSVKMDTCRATIFYVKASALPKKMKTADVAVAATYEPHVKSQNIIGFQPGKIRDTFIVICAHYDHLGKMGPAIFPGASDNASGTAMMLYLARYFSTHPQKYSIMYIAFSGEEAALIGSLYFTKHPVIPLKSIKFLTNIDIMGDATDGITVVNATEFPREFDELQKINTTNKLLPAIKSRGKAANSDHYYFTEAGVPSFFIYSDGGPGFYHDVYDRASTLSLNKVDNVAKLLIDFFSNYNLY